MIINVGLNEAAKMVIDTKSIRKGCFADRGIQGHIAIEYDHSYWGSDIARFDFIAIGIGKDEHYYYCACIVEDSVEVKCFTEDDYNFICEEYNVEPHTITFN